MVVDPALADRLYARSQASRWHLAPARFAGALAASATHAFTGRPPHADDLRRYLEGLHLDDLALACACADGVEDAWEHFVREHRPALYRAADALAPDGSARELADSLYADLFGLRDDQAGERRSLFRYFHGRSRLSTWLRAVLSQRHVDRIRAIRRTDPLPDDESSRPIGASPAPAEPGRTRYAAAMQAALAAALAGLAPRDRLRLACYYARELTLAQTGRVLGEHEATVSRHLARTRKALRIDLERRLREDAGLSEADVAACVASMSEDAGPLDLRPMLGGGPDRKESA